MKKFYTAKYDRVFKAIFCDENNKHMMVKLLESILEKNISDLKFLNNELPVNNIYERSKTVDVLALVDNEYVHIELNSNCSKFLHMRNFVYFSEIYSKKTKRGDEYDYKTKFIHIDLTYGLKEGFDVLKYYLMNKDGIKYLDNIEIIEFNMDSLKKYCYTETSEEYLKFKHLIMLNLDKKELENLVFGDEFMKEYKDRIELLNEDTTFVSAISYEDDQRLTLNTEKRISFEEGIEQGIEQGINISVQNMYKNNIDIERITKILEISQDRVKEILEKYNH